VDPVGYRRIKYPPVKQKEVELGAPPDSVPKLDSKVQKDFITRLGGKFLFHLIVVGVLTMNHRPEFKHQMQLEVEYTYPISPCFPLILRWKSYYPVKHTSILCALFPVQVRLNE
jgi:hypothetical protein